MKSMLPLLCVNVVSCPTGLSSLSLTLADLKTLGTHTHVNADCNSISLPFVFRYSHEMLNTLHALFDMSYNDSLYVVFSLKLIV